MTSSEHSGSERTGAEHTGSGHTGEATRWSKATIYPDMWVDPAEDPRETDAEAGAEAGAGAGTEAGTEPSDERSILLGYLRRYRLTLEMKCADLTPEQLATRSVPPSTMSLLGLVRHMAEVERRWFRAEMAQLDAPRLYMTAEDRDADFNGAVADPAVVDEAWQTWRDQVAFAEEYVAQTADLDTLGASGYPLRDIVVHMIEEYARHCGHADLLRERIDGRVGQ